MVDTILTSYMNKRALGEPQAATTQSPPQELLSRIAQTRLEM
ncbi:MAG: hypothetical protein AB7E85_04485 [Pseudobdellovibrionaceae bacterium]